MSDFNLTELVLKSYYGDNSIITDDQGLPSVMVYIPKFKMSEVIDGGSDSVHPAFIINGEEKDGIYISKYQNTVYNGRAYSIPGEDPAAEMSFDMASEYCASKGNGWHLITAIEWGAIALWCIKNGWLPYGNNDFGKDAQENVYKAVPTVENNAGMVTRVATGSGPVEWSHNKQLDGIYDLNGNINELCGGLRFVYGELQILKNNNAADSSNSQDADSPVWKAIDGTTGDLITPDGNGTTPNSLKLDIYSSDPYCHKWITGTLSNQDSGYSIYFGNVSADNTVCDAAKELLYALALLPVDTQSDYCNNTVIIANDAAEVIIGRGGMHNKKGTAGICYCSSTNRKTALYGFRAAYYE